MNMIDKDKKYALFLIDSFNELVGYAYHTHTPNELIIDIYKRIRKQIANLENISDTDTIRYLNMLKDIKNKCSKD